MWHERLTRQTVLRCKIACINHQCYENKCQTTLNSKCYKWMLMGCGCVLVSVRVYECVWHKWKMWIKSSTSHTFYYQFRKRMLCEMWMDVKVPLKPGPFEPYAFNIKSSHRQRAGIATSQQKIQMQRLTVNRSDVPIFSHIHEKPLSKRRFSSLQCGFVQGGTEACDARIDCSGSIMYPQCNVAIVTISLASKCRCIHLIFEMKVSWVTCTPIVVHTLNGCATRVNWLSGEPPFSY